MGFMGATSAWRPEPGHRQIRKQLLAALRDGDPCWRCGAPMYRAQARWLDVGHVVDRALGGTLAHGARLEHRFCNRSAGAAMGNRMRPRRALTAAQRRAIAAKRAGVLAAARPSPRW